jgi:hypothetical protein
VFEFRVTKYDPARRDSNGSHIADEWTSFGDIGKSFSGVLLTEAEYHRVEDAYVVAATSFMREAGVPFLLVTGLENSAGAPLSFGEATALSSAEFGAVIRRVLREDFWCRLEADGGFVHIGWDYYMYVGVQRACPSATVAAHRLGLFVETFYSPYSERADV